jgi:hypothetical protein
MTRLWNRAPDSRNGLARQANSLRRWRNSSECLQGKDSHVADGGQNRYFSEALFSASMFRRSEFRSE